MSSFNPPSGVKFFSEETRLDELYNDTKKSAPNLGTLSSTFVYMGSTTGSDDLDFICFTAGKSGTLTVSLYSDSNTFSVSNTEIYLDDILSGTKATPYQNLRLSVSKGTKLYFAIKNYKLYQTAEFYSWQFSFSDSSSVVNSAFCDQGWNDYLYDSTAKRLNYSILNSVGTTLNAKTTSVFLDEEGFVDHNGWNNYVGAGSVPDEADYVKINLETAAVISFVVNAADAVKFVICDLIGTVKNGLTIYKEKSLQTTKLSKLKNGSGYEAKTNGLLLEAGTYYLSVESTNYKKGGSAFYNVYVNHEDSLFFTDSDDGWNDDVSKAKSNPVWITRSYELPVVLDSNEKNADGWKNFVGFGDKTDFAKINLTSSASLSFKIRTTGNVKFQIWKLDLGNGKLSKVGPATSLKPKNGLSVATTTTKAQFFNADSGYEYYISMESADAAKGGAAYYDLSVHTAGSCFFDSADNARNNVLYDKKTKTFKSDSNFSIINLLPGTSCLQLDSEKAAHEDYSNYVGYGDPADYAKLVLSDDSVLDFILEASADATFEVSRKTEKKGKATLDVLCTVKLKLANGAVSANDSISGLSLAKGEYYISMTAKKTTNDAKGCVFYDVIAYSESIVADALAMPETELAPSNSLAMTDSLSFGQYGADALADVSATSSTFATLDDKSAWQSLLA